MNYDDTINKTRELMKADAQGPTIDQMQKIVLEVEYCAVGIVAHDKRVVRVRVDDGEYRAAASGASLNKSIRWLSENGFELARNPVRSKNRTGTQIERHFWRRSLMGEANVEPADRSPRIYGA